MIEKDVLQQIALINNIFLEQFTDLKEVFCHGPLC